MLFLSVAHHYLLWHYSRAFSEIFHVWLNFLWFVIHFFSLPQLLRAWFSPWKRMVETRGNTWDLEDLAGYIIVGLLSRLVGAIMRTGVIVIGLVCLTLTIIGGILVYLFWVGAPVLLLGIFATGITVIVL